MLNGSLMEKFAYLLLFTRSACECTIVSYGGGAPGSLAVQCYKIQICLLFYMYIHVFCQCEMTKLYVACLVWCGLN